MKIRFEPPLEAERRIHKALYTASEKTSQCLLVLLVLLITC